MRVAPVFCQLCVRGYTLAPITRSPECDYGVGAKRFDEKGWPVDDGALWSIQVDNLDDMHPRDDSFRNGQLFRHRHMLTINHHLAEKHLRNCWWTSHVNGDEGDALLKQSSIKRSDVKEMDAYFDHGAGRR